MSFEERLFGAIQTEGDFSVAASLSSMVNMVLTLTIFRHRPCRCARAKGLQLMAQPTSRSLRWRRPQRQSQQWRRLRRRAPRSAVAQLTTLRTSVVALLARWRQHIGRPGRRKEFCAMSRSDRRRKHERGRSSPSGPRRHPSPCRPSFYSQQPSFYSQQQPSRSSRPSTSDVRLRLIDAQPQRRAILDR